MKRDRQKSAVHKRRMEGNRWIEGVRQKERQGWKGGIKWGRDKHTETDRKRLFRMPMLHTLSSGIRAARWLLTQHTQTHTYTTHKHTQLHVAKKTCWAPAELWVIVSISLRHNTYKQTYCAAWVPPLQAFWHFPDKKEKIWRFCLVVLREWEESRSFASL